MDNSNNLVKEIPFLINETGKTIKVKKERRDRVVTNEKKWILDECDYNSRDQIELMKRSDINDKKYNLITYLL